MLRLLAVIFLASNLAACGGDGIRPRLFPPSASIQELSVQPDGSWKLKVRVQNFSNVAMTIERVDATLKIAAAEAGQVTLLPKLSVSPESAEVFETSLRPKTSAANLVNSATSKLMDGQVAYSLTGTIAASQPDARRDEFEFKSRLTTVPGLERVLR